MNKFWIRLVSVAMVVVILLGYNMALDAREKDDEIARLTAQVQSLQQSGSSEDSPENVSAGYADGTYTGEAQGFGGMISVEVIISGGSVTEINILSADKEDGAYFAMAQDIIPAIIENQSAEVDTISGATFSSTGIKDAAAMALEEAAE